MINWADWGIWIIYFVGIFLSLWFYRSTKSDIKYKFFIKGFLIKILGSLAFTLVYVYYYKFGDSFEYYKGTLALSDALSNSIQDYIDLLFSESSVDFSSHLRQYTSSLAYADTPEEWFMVKLLSPFTLISFKSYLVINLFMGLMSFWGAWKLFKVFIDILPGKNRIAFISVFLIPSIIFWGGGIMKDTVTLIGVNYIIYAVYFSMIKKKTKLVYFIAVPIWFYITFKLKSYITIALFPGLVLTFYYHLKSRITSKFIRMTTGPILITLLAVVSFYSLQMLSESSQKYSAKELEWKVKGIHSWHTDVGGSSYNLGEIDYSIRGMIAKVPAALNVTFFRPYIWEAKNPVVLLGAFESLLILFLSIYAIIRSHISLLTSLKNFRLLKIIINFSLIVSLVLLLLSSISNALSILFIPSVLVLASILFYGILNILKDQPVLKGMLVFILIFGFAIGFTSYNFGALGRYKIPIFSLFSFTLFYIISKSKAKRII